MKRLSYQYKHYEWKALLAFYSAWLKLIEKGSKTWDNDFSTLEFRMLMGHEKLQKEKSQKSNKKFERKEQVFFCPGFQRNKCSQSGTHNMMIKGTNRQVEHICATCWKTDNTKLKHPECSNACPHQEQQ